MTLSKQYVVLSVLTLIALLATMVVGPSAMTVSAANGGQERVIVTFEHDVNERARGALQSRGGEIIKELSIVNGIVAVVPEQAIRGLGSISGVKSVEKDVRVYAIHHRDGHNGGPGNNGGGDDDGSTTQPAETLEWGVDRIDADLAWVTGRGAGIKVAIIDTGIDKDHEDLKANIKGGENFVASKNGPPHKRTVKSGEWDDDNGHGTHVAGIVAATDNEIGVIGVAPDAHLYGVKVLDSSGSGYLSDVIDGIGWSVNNGMDVVNMSLGSSSDSPSLREAVDAAYAAGVVLVAAAGNSGDGDGTTNRVNYPAKYASVIAIAATDSNDNTPTWSSEGEEVELAAPGADIRSTWNDGLYKTISGTSMASPHAAGVVALVLVTGIPAEYDANSNGTWDPAEVRVALRDSAEDLGTAGHDNFYGHGLIDAQASVTN